MPIGRDYYEPQDIVTLGGASTGVPTVFNVKDTGVVTWNAVFKLAGAFTNPASTKRRTITFRYDGTSWVEQYRVAADI